MIDYITLIPDNAAVDAATLLKGDSIHGILNTFGYDLGEAAAIGDELIDLTMLRILGLSSIGTVANAQKPVIEYIKSQKHGFFSDNEVFDGFLDFYQHCKNQNVKIVISDKDGVLKKGGNTSWGTHYADLTFQMGYNNNPLCVILTGSSVSQNFKFMSKYGLDERLSKNAYIADKPYLIAAENGAVLIHVLTKKAVSNAKNINPDFLDALKGPFEEKVLMDVAAYASKEFGFGVSYSESDQAGKVYVFGMQKKTMVSINVPRTYADGRDFRESEDAARFRKGIIELMKEAAEKTGIKYRDFAI